MWKRLTVEVHCGEGECLPCYCEPKDSPVNMAPAEKTAALELLRSSADERSQVPGCEQGAVAGNMQL
ncbi:hypothetical protein NDU88_003250 [Pleurodeles waltl]|uniref:Uncharacterized protein n=1 Tax=Pleurodeles waltl TaxID=8319 RepID=A0AAV7SG03_PLEWA|nr:hypothetical protein NDU88_003250 [Pleurodeles waltl]